MTVRHLLWVFGALLGLVAGAFVYARLSEVRAPVVTVGDAGMPRDAGVRTAPTDSGSPTHVANADGGHVAGDIDAGQVVSPDSGESSAEIDGSEHSAPSRWATLVESLAGKEPRGEPSIEEKAIGGCLVLFVEHHGLVYDDSAADAVKTSSREVLSVSQDGGLLDRLAAGSTRSSEGSYEEAATFATRSGFAALNGESRRADDDGDIGPMEIVRTRRVFALNASCHFEKQPLEGLWSDPSTLERLVVSTPTEPPDAKNVPDLEVAYASEKRPNPVVLELRAFDVEQLTAKVAFANGDEYELSFDGGVLTSTGANGTSQRFLFVQ